MILEYFRSKTDYSKKGYHGAQAPTYQHQTQQSVPMEIDAYFKKGKGKGKGRKGGKTGKVKDLRHQAQKERAGFGIRQPLPRAKEKDLWKG